jgi:myo-inositol catabolism protein IolS
VVQYGWNMFDRRMQTEILPYCEKNGVGFMAYGSLAFGLLTGTFTEDHDFGGTDWRARQGNMGTIKMFAALFGPEKFKDNVRAVEELKEIAARYDKSLPQLALRWAISHPAVSTALVGCRNVTEVEDNVGAIGWEISAKDLAAIDAIFERHGVDTTPDFWIEEA